MTQNLSEYNITDKYSHLAIDSIFPLSSRALSLLSRNKNKEELQENAITLFGAIDMIKSLEYHFDNFITIKNKNGSLPPLSERQNFTLLDIEKRNENFKKMTYEAVAYINRIGQFYYFSKSIFVKLRIPLGSENILTKSNTLIPFRNKNTAHRSLDAPRGETEYDKIYQALSMGNLGHFSKPDGGVTHQIQTNGNFIYFDLEVDNIDILNEFYEMFRQIVEN